MSSSPPPIFVINMDKSLDRLSRMSTQIPKLGQNFIRVTGVVGSELSPQEIKENSTYLCRTFCTYSQIGCFLSHKKVWQMIADGPDEMAIVLEDDCEVIDNFNKDYLDTIKAVSQVDPNWDFVYLGCFGGCSVDRSSYGIMSRLSVLASKNLTQPDGFLSDLLYVPQSPVGFHCYTLTRSCARKLLKKMEKVEYHVDVTFLNYADDFRIYATKKQLGYQFSTAENSTLTESKFPVLLNRINTTRDNYGIEHSYYFTTPLFEIFRQPVNLYLVLLLLLAIIVPSKFLGFEIIVRSYLLLELFIDQKNYGPVFFWWILFESIRSVKDSS